jgi:hypothetical protein
MKFSLDKYVTYNLAQGCQVLVSFVTDEREVMKVVDVEATGVFGLYTRKGTKNVLNSM